MAYTFDTDDVAFLRSDDGAAVLAELDRRPLTAKSRMDDVATARRLAGERFSSAALETAVLRRRAESKVADPSRWLFTDPALQQATPAEVARHRARRLSGRDVHDVTCSVGADLHEIATQAWHSVGSDLDSVRLAMARHNLRETRALLVRADALRPTTRATAVVADPARRDSAGRRTWKAADLVPRLDELVETYAGRDLTVKCAPGLDFAAVPESAEVEVVSLDARVREACLWFGELATPGVRRRATVLRRTASGGCAKWTITDTESDECPERPVGQWIVDPDGSVVRAGLVRQYAARHGLGQLDHRIAYLTGDAPPPDVRAFRVFDSGRHNEKALRALLRKHRIGVVEILVRGLDVDPDALRRRLKPKGPGSASVLLTRVGSTPMAYLCVAERTPPA
ncbi:class I SAM-dependent methyltransferase [Allosaccharopolyspora coralli]|uniref:Class I SAM-dependent methyltransferase n=1 Tax=Allosaccharopolyspora coralli TaxID=2665642 RepID=A0A5Q3Q9J0_9PSEU|nr:class I SAM-dependent methyltransferase [Allosaccharopolyspora coralli]QGK71132.1 class I SAM-dependent methyltransferase [Allosaccharopolyspora coralli]